MKIKNVKGSSKVSPNPPVGYDSWLHYWEFNYGNSLKGIKFACPACGIRFSRDRFDGCHVQKVGTTDKKWYIMPLCDSCNHRTDEPEIDGGLLIDVPSNINVTYKD